jgi:hypothetical protein
MVFPSQNSRAIRFLKLVAVAERMQHLDFKEQSIRQNRFEE